MAFRAATMLGGSVPSRRLAREISGGTTRRAPTRTPVADTIDPNAAKRNPAGPLPSPSQAAPRNTRAPKPIRPNAVARRIAPTTRVSGAGTDVPSKAWAGVARSTAREPTHAAAAAAAVITTTAGIESSGNHGRHRVDRKHLLAGSHQRGHTQAPAVGLDPDLHHGGCLTGSRSA